MEKGKIVRKPAAPQSSRDLVSAAQEGERFHDESVPMDELQDETAGGDVFDIIKDLEDQLGSAYAMQEALTQDRDALSAELLLLRETNEEQKRRIRFLEDKIPDLDTLREELEFAEQERTRAQSIVSSLTAELEIKNRDLAAQGEALETAKVQLKETKTSNIKLEIELNQFKDRVRHLQPLEEKLANLQREYDQATTRIEELEGALRQAGAIQDELRSTLDETRQTAAQLQAGNANQMKANEDLERENREVRTQVAMLSGENDRLKAKLAKLEEDLAHANGETQRLEADLITTRETMARIHTALAGTKAKAHRVDLTTR